MEENKKEEQSTKSLKTWDEAFKELGAFIKASKAAEAEATAEKEKA